MFGAPFEEHESAAYGVKFTKKVTCLSSLWRRWLERNLVSPPVTPLCASDYNNTWLKSTMGSLCCKCHTAQTKRREQGQLEKYPYPKTYVPEILKMAFDLPPLVSVPHYKSHWHLHFSGKFLLASLWLQRLLWGFASQEWGSASQVPQPTGRDLF